MYNASKTEGIRIFGSIFVDLIKNANKSIRYKRGLVAQNYEAEQSAPIAKKASTVQPFAQQPLLSLAASIETFSTHTRNVTQTYIQSKTCLEGHFDIERSEGMTLHADNVLWVRKPWHGVQDCWLNWCLAYLRRYREKFGMIRSKVVPCFLYRREKSALTVLMILQVGDFLVVGTKALRKIENRESTVFLLKPRGTLQPVVACFNGFVL